jgi:hypothetical protein
MYKQKINQLTDLIIQFHDNELIVGVFDFKFGYFYDFWVVNQIRTTFNTEEFKVFLVEKINEKFTNEDVDCILFKLKPLILMNKIINFKYN